MGLFQFAIIVFTSTTHAGFFEGNSAALIFFGGEGRAGIGEGNVLLHNLNAEAGSKPLFLNFTKPFCFPVKIILGLHVTSSFSKIQN